MSEPATTWPECALAFLAGSPLPTPDVIVLGARHNGAECGYATPEEALSVRSDPARYVLWRLEAGDPRPTAEDLRSLAELASLELAVALPAEDAGIPLAAVLWAAEDAGLVLVGMAPLAHGAAKGTIDLLRFVSDRGLAYSGERLNLARAPAKTVYEHCARYAFVREHARGARVLDLGCGEGIGSVYLASVAAEVVGIDLSDEAIRVARSTRSAPNVRYHVGDVVRLDDSLGDFDVIVCLEVIEHLHPETQRAAVSQLAARLRPGGIAILSTPDPRYDPPNDFHEGDLDATALDELLAAFFPYRRMFESRLALGATVVPIESPREAPGVDAVPARVRHVRSAEDRHTLEASARPDGHYFVVMASREPLPEAWQLLAIDPADRLLVDIETTRTKQIRMLRQLRRELHDVQDELRETREGFQDEGARLRQELFAAYRVTLERQRHAEGRRTAVHRVLAALWRALRSVPPYALPSASEVGSGPDALARWLYEYHLLDQRRRRLSEELDDVVSSRSFLRMVRLRDWVRGRLGRGVPSGSPRHTGALASGAVEVEAVTVKAAKDAATRLHREVEHLRVRLNRPPMRPLRVLRAVKRASRELRPGRVAHLTRVFRRLAERPLPPASPLLDAAQCPDRISIILPTYNRAHLLPRAIRSVLQQSYTNWQLIVIDDGSDDATDELATRFDDPRILWVSTPHGGVSCARNAGLALAEGEYVAFLDSDNVWYATFLERQHAALAAADAGVVAVYCDLKLFLDDRLDSVLSPQFSEAELFHRPQVDLNSIVVRREAIESGGAFDECMDKWVDYELMLRLSQQGRLVHVPEVLGDYHRLEDGISRAPAAERPLAPNLDRIRRLRARMLRVGYVLWDYPAASQAFVHREIRALVEAGVDVIVYYAEPPATAATSKPDVPTYQVRSEAELAKLATEHGRHVLHGHFVYPTTTVHLWPAAERARIPFTFTGHGVDLFHHKNERRARLGEIGRSPYCKAAFALGGFHREHLIQQGVPASVIAPIRCAVEASWLAPLPDFARPIRKVFLVGRWVPKKGVLDFIEVARACVDTPLQFELYGYGPLEGEVARAAEGVSNVTVHVGVLSESEVRSICDEGSAVLLPCRRADDGDMDGLPVILMEGAARGCLLISSSLSSIPDLIRDGQSGLLVEPGDLDGYVRAVRAALELSPKKLAALRRAAYEKVRDEFVTHAVVRELIDCWCR